MLLCVAMVLPLFVFNTGAEPVNFDEANIGIGFRGKKISILGDSISTYAGVSNDGSANSTITDNSVYYTEGNEWGVTREDTWWQQAIDQLGLELCVNNSYSGSGVMGWDTSVSNSNPAGDGTIDYNDVTCAWMNRCVQLHTASANPDIIAVYLGTNDIKNVTSGMDTFAQNKNTMLSEAAGTSTSVKKFSMYIRMVNKILEKYASAQVYLFTLLPNESQNDTQIKAMEQYNQSIRDLVTYYQGQSKKVYLVDLYNETGITRDFEILKKHLANTLHPNAEGMDVITNCFMSSLVDYSKFSDAYDNWRTVVYDLTDVYVRGGQINTIRASNSGNYPFSVSLAPSRPEYDMEVKVERRTGASSWEDITSTAYSDGTIFIRNLPRNDYNEGLRITAKAVYTPKNFRWESGSGALTSCVMDGTDYHITGTLSENPLTLTAGTDTAGTMAGAQYKLNDSILLRNEEPWVVEWKVKGALSTDQFFFSGGDTANDRSNIFVFYDNAMNLHLGYYNVYRGRYWNYGLNLGSLTMDANTSHTFRLANRVNADGSNMVYLYVDDVEKGAMDQYHVNTGAQTGELATQQWLNGRDLEFSFFGGGSGFYLNDCNIEYIQVWEGGGYDTLRLQQLVAEYHDELESTMANANNFAAYKSAVEAAEAYLNNTANEDRTQQAYDDHVTAVVTARNNLTENADATEIISVELLSRNYVPMGKQAGLKILTTPDVQKIQVGNSAMPLLTHTSSIQTLTINGEEREVKVWLVSWMRKETTQRVVQYRIHALKDASVTASASNYGDASVVFNVPFGANSLAYIEVTGKPDKLVYSEGETFDPTGMEVTAYYGDGSRSKVITDYTIVNNGALTPEDRYVTIRFDDETGGSGYVTVDLPIEVIAK